jgi:hypothetical protein
MEWFVAPLKGKENNKAGAIYFEVRIPKKKRENTFWSDSM